MLENCKVVRLLTCRVLQELHSTGFALLRTPEAMHGDIDSIQDTMKAFFELPQETKDACGEFKIVSGKV